MKDEIQSIIDNQYEVDNTDIQNNGKPLIRPAVFRGNMRSLSASESITPREAHKAVGEELDRLYGLVRSLEKKVLDKELKLEEAGKLIMDLSGQVGYWKNIYVKYQDQNDWNVIYMILSLCCAFVGLGYFVYAVL